MDGDLWADEELILSDEEDQQQMVPTLRDLSTFKVMTMTARRDLKQGCIRPYGTALALQRLWDEKEEDINWIITVYDGTNTEYYKFLSKQLQKEYANITHDIRLWANEIENTLYNHGIHIHQTLSDVVYRCYLSYQ